MKNRFKLIVLLIMVVGILTVGAACGRKPQSVPVVKPVKVMEATWSVYQNEIVYFGAIQPEKLKKYSFQNGGKIQDLIVSLGMEVKSGNVLATLDSQDYDFNQSAMASTYNAAKGAAEYAQNNYENMKILYEKGSISKDDLDKSLQGKNSAESNLTSATASYNNAKHTVQNTVLKSDIDGVVAEVLFESGEMVGAGIPVVVVSSKEQKAVIGVSISDVDKIKEGVMVRVCSDKQELVGTVKNIEKLPDMATRTYAVEISMEDGSFTLGSFVDVKIPVSTGAGIMLPITSLMDNNGTYVYLVDAKGKAEKKSVEVNEIRDTDVIVTGISEGEKVIVSGMKALKPNDSVKIVE